MYTFICCNIKYTIIYNTHTHVYIPLYPSYVENVGDYVLLILMVLSNYEDYKYVFHCSELW